MLLPELNLLHHVFVHMLLRVHHKLILESVHHRHAVNLIEVLAQVGHTGRDSVLLLHLEECTLECLHFLDDKVEHLEVRLRAV